MRRERRMHLIALSAYAALLALIVLWEGWLAPAMSVPRGFWLGIETVPLLAFGLVLWRGGARAYILAALVTLLYFCDGIATGYHAAKTAQSAALAYAVAETILSVIFIAAASFYARFMLRDASLPAAAERGS